MIELKQQNGIGRAFRTTLILSALIFVTYTPTVQADVDPLAGLQAKIDAYQSCITGQAKLDVDKALSKCRSTLNDAVTALPAKPKSELKEALASSARAYLESNGKK